MWHKPIMKYKSCVIYMDDDNKFIQETINLKCDNADFKDCHIITFYNCSKENKKIRKYIDEDFYFYYDYGICVGPYGKRCKYVSIVTLLTEQIEGRMVMLKLTQ